MNFRAYVDQLAAAQAVSRQAVFVSIAKRSRLSVTTITSLYRGMIPGKTESLVAIVQATDGVVTIADLLPPSPSCPPRS